MSIKPILYRVETYIVPEVNKRPLQAATNDIDDTKVANKSLNIFENVINNSTPNKEDALLLHRNQYAESTIYVTKDSHCKSINAEITKDLMNNRETRYSKQIDSDNDYYTDKNLSHSAMRPNAFEFQASVKSQDRFYPVKQFKRVNSLMSIDESSEAESKVSAFCHHGYKNGCTAMIPAPEEVSEEVFKENWLQKIEILRQREAAVMEKEATLQLRERQLFKQEKELRIKERFLMDKQRHLDWQLKRQEKMQIVEERLEEVGRILESKNFKESHSSQLQINESEKTERLKNAQPSSNPSEKTKEPDKKSRNIIQSKSCSSWKYPSSSNVTSQYNSYGSMRYKERPKISYNDLDSTLSADAGDSSFVRTSERFNPEMYKKPYVFTRSVSERWSRKQTNVISAKTIPEMEEIPEHPVEEDKILRKFSENICATQDKATKFQNYGLVDTRLSDVPDNAERNPGNEKQFSHLDLAIGNKFSHKKPTATISKNRPNSWSEETDQWLQKKRQAYNAATKKSIDNKENLKCNNDAEKSGKTLKKDVKSKLFTLFL